VSRGTVIKINEMNNSEEFKELKNDFNLIGITGEKEQKEIIEYFYRLGKIIYNFKISGYGEEN
jgi:myosin heavy subunit